MSKSNGRLFFTIFDAGAGAVTGSLLVVLTGVLCAILLPFVHIGHWLHKESLHLYSRQGTDEVAIESRASSTKELPMKLEHNSRRRKKRVCLLLPSLLLAKLFWVE